MDVDLLGSIADYVEVDRFADLHVDLAVERHDLAVDELDLDRDALGRLARRTHRGLRRRLGDGGLALAPTTRQGEHEQQGGSCRLHSVPFSSGSASKARSMSSRSSRSSCRSLRAM